MTLTRVFDRTGTPHWRTETGRPLRRTDPLRCKCGGKHNNGSTVDQVCMRCYTCRAHCKCWPSRPR